MDQSMWSSRAWSRTKSTSRSLGAVRGVQWTFSIHSSYLLKSQPENKKFSWSVWICVNFFIFFETLEWKDGTAGGNGFPTVQQRCDTNAGWEKYKRHSVEWGEYDTIPVLLFFFFFEGSKYLRKALLVFALVWEESYKGNHNDLLTSTQNGECANASLVVHWPFQTRRQIFRRVLLSCDTMLLWMFALKLRSKNT